MIRRVALLAVLPLFSCSLALGPEPASDSQAIFHELWLELDRHYALFDVKGVDWSAVGSRYQPQLAGASTPELLDTLRVVLDLLDDPHVVLDAQGTHIQSGAARTSVPTRFSAMTVFSEYVDDAQVTPGGPMRFGHAAPDIGYVRIESFGGSGWGAGIDIALGDLAGVAGLIIDVRDNGGGNDANALDIAGRFTDRSRLFMHTRFRNGPRHGDLTAFTPRFIHPGGTPFNGDVIVLMNRRTASAAESFALMMQAIPGVRTIGDTTMGVLSNPLPRELSNGWSFRLSESITYSVDFEVIEDVGVVPSIVVPATIADSTVRVDRALERAIELLSSPSALAGTPGGPRGGTRVADRRSRSPS